MLVADGARRRGELTRAAIDVLRALLFKFANPKDGRCFPSHERLGEPAGCHARTVGRALKALERIRLVTWAHRLLRVAEPVAGLLETRDEEDAGDGLARQWRAARDGGACEAGAP
jgi:hypothetical protein